MEKNNHTNYISEDDELDDTILDESLLEDDSYKSIFDKNQLTEIHNRKHNKPEHYKAYVKKKEQYMDIYSSGITFLVVAIIGVLLIILNLMQIIVIFNGLLSFTIMSILFLVFLIIGISSLRKSKIIKGQIGEEEKVTATLTNWLKTNISETDLYNNADNIQEPSERYLSMLEYMKDCLTHQFGELEDSYLDYIVENFYDEYIS